MNNYIICCITHKCIYAYAVQFDYPCFEAIRALRIHSLIGNDVLEGIIHVSTLTAMVSIRHCRMSTLKYMFARQLCVPEQSMMFCSLSRVSLPLARAQAPSRAPIALKA